MELFYVFLFPIGGLSLDMSRSVSDFVELGRFGNLYKEQGWKKKRNYKNHKKQCTVSVILVVQFVTDVGYSKPILLLVAVVVA